MGDIWQNVMLTGVVIVVAAVLRAVLRFAIRRTVRVLTARAHHTNDDLGAKARRVLEKASGASTERASLPLFSSSNWRARTRRYPS